MFKESMSGPYLAVNMAPYRPTGRREWIQSDSEAFQVLSEIVLDEHWLKNVEKFLSFRYCKLYNKKSKPWSLYTVKVEKDYGCRVLS
ncbi:unnamed protein product [Boreogadus saida]